MTKVATVSSLPPGFNNLSSYKYKTDIVQRIREATEIAKKTGLPEVIVNEFITKEKAEDLETLNVKNRTSSEARSLNFVSKQKQGEWKVNGDTFKFDEDNRFIDGQHRNAMIILSGIGAYYTLMCGLKRDVMTTIDSGKKRTAADWAAIEGYENPTRITTAVRLLLLLRVGQVSPRITTAKVDTDNIAAFLANGTNRKKMEAHLGESMKTYHNQGSFLTSPQWAALSYFLTEEHNRDKALIFIPNLASASGNHKTGRNHQIWHLRILLENLKPEQAGKKKKPMKANSTDMLMLKFKYIIKAWNYFVKEMRLDELKLTDKEWDSPTLPVAQH